MTMDEKEIKDSLLYDALLEFSKIADTCEKNIQIIKGEMLKDRRKEFVETGLVSGS